MEIGPRQWLSWARLYVARLDPLRKPPLMPDPPEETPDALQAFMPNGWSVHGPEHGRSAFGTRRFPPR